MLLRSSQWSRCGSMVYTQCIIHCILKRRIELCVQFWFFDCSNPRYNAGVLNFLFSNDNIPCWPLNKYKQLRNLSCRQNPSNSYLAHEPIWRIASVKYPSKFISCCKYLKNNRGILEISSPPCPFNKTMMPDFRTFLYIEFGRHYMGLALSLDRPVERTIRSLHLNWPVDPEYNKLDQIDQYQNSLNKFSLIIPFILIIYTEKVLTCSWRNRFGHHRNTGWIKPSAQCWPPTGTSERRRSWTALPKKFKESLILLCIRSCYRLNLTD